MLYITNNIIDVYKEFFKLVNEFLELEKTIQKQSGLRYLFKKIDYKDRADTFNSLWEKSIVKKNKLFPYNNTEGMNQIECLLKHLLIECIDMYKDMVACQYGININLDQKTNGEWYSWDNHINQIDNYKLAREQLGAKLPQLVSVLHDSLLTDFETIESIKEKENIEKDQIEKENMLAEIVISEYLIELEKKFNNVVACLLDLGFNENDFKDEWWMKHDLFLCGLTLDGISLFNFIEKSRANRLFRYISFDRFQDLDNRELGNYSIGQIEECKRLYDKALQNNEPPFDFIFSKLFYNLLGENIYKYEIGFIEMITLISLVVPIFSGKWKKNLEKYNII